MRIPISCEPHGYDIVLERGALQHIGELLPLDRKVLVVTDSGVPERYSAAVAAACRTAVRVCLPQGEASKNMEQLQVLLRAMLDNGFTRSDCVVAVGGGMVGDLSGFAAACYMRGIDFYNVPTTLLSQVDSSIGGKTAIDFAGVKNIVGAFYMPGCVVIDPDTLDTLEPRQLHAGLAEAIKMAATGDLALFERMERSTDLSADLTDIIYHALCIKKDVVEQDPTERGLRRVLNFGHTIGHAVEAASGTLLHGECVAVGMLPMCAPAVRSRLQAVLEKYDLPVRTERTAAELMPFMLHDKKKQADVIKTVLVERLGSFVFCDMTPDEIMERLGGQK